MFSMEERDAYRESERPHRRSQQPSYLQDYEVGYLAKHCPPYDEQVRWTTSHEVLQYIHNMREEHDQLRRERIQTYSLAIL